MSMKTPAYNLPARALHWLVLGLLVVQYIGAQIMPEGEDDAAVTAPAAGSLVDWHMSLGVLIGLVILVRLAWRVTWKAPAPPQNQPAWQEKAASLTHLALYGLLVLIPLAGWAWASALGWTVTLFHTLSLPPLVAAGTWPDLFGNLHALMGNLMLAAVGLHLIAALWHQYVLRDGLLGRMWPGRNG